MSRYERFSEVIAAWNAGNIDATLAGMDDGIVWHVATGAMAPLVGKPEVRRFLELLRSDVIDVRWSIVNHAEAGDMLFVEGIDAYTRSNGVMVAMPYAAVVQFRCDRICSWRDYIDTRRMEKLREGKAPPAFISELVEVANDSGPDSEMPPG